MEILCRLDKMYTSTELQGVYQLFLPIFRTKKTCSANQNLVILIFFENLALGGFNSFLILALIIGRNSYKTTLCQQHLAESLVTGGLNFLVIRTS